MSGKSTHPMTRAILGIAALSAIAVLGNILVSSLGIGHRGVDFTENKVYTLSEGTRAIVKELQAPVVIRYYASRSASYMPEDLKLHMRRVDDLLKEYATLSDGKLRVQHLDPQPDTDAEDAANLDGVQGQRIDDENLFFGLAVSCLDQTSVIPFLNPQDETMLEYQLSKAIAEVSSTRKPVIGVMSALELGGSTPMMGQRTASPWMIYQQLKQSFEIRDFGMEPGEIDPKEVKVLLLLHPANITPEAEYVIDQYVLKGGTVVACLDAYSIAAQMSGGGNPMAGGIVSSLSTLPTLLGTWGVKFESNEVVADPTYATVVSGNRKGVAVLTLPKAAMPQKDDVITRDLDSVTLFLPGGFTKTSDTGLTVTSLLRTTDKAALVDSRRASQLDPKLETSMQRKGDAYDLVLALSGTFKTAFPNGKPASEKAGETKPAAAEKTESLKQGTAPGHVFLIADVDAFHDNFAYAVQRFGNTQVASPINGNSSLLLNILDQAAGSQHLIGARSRAATRRPFTVIQEIETKFNEKVGSEIARFQEKQEEARQKLSELQAQKTRDSELHLSPEQEAEIVQLRRQQVEASRSIRNLEKDLKREKDNLSGRITLLNVAAMPALVTLFAIGLFIVHRSRTRAR
jgi:ABC-type uncharacterized transport system involved in gliding motility auxiliary subunit